MSREPMIEGKVAVAPTALALRLTKRAARLAEARARRILIARRGGEERRWRRAALLWPLFAKD